MVMMSLGGGGGRGMSQQSSPVAQLWGGCVRLNEQTRLTGGGGGSVGLNFFLFYMFVVLFV